MEDALKALSEAAIENHVFPGVVIGIVRGDGSRTVLPFGRFTYDKNAPEIREDSIYDCASITKAIPTSSLALKALEERKLNLDDKLIDYVPEFKNSYRDQLLIRHLLTYGIVYKNDGENLAKFSHLGSEALFDRLMTKEFSMPPGEGFIYTNTPAFLTGLVLERIYGKPLDILADETFFKPLEMTDTSFHPETVDLKRIVPTEGDIHGIVHDESARTFRTDGNRTVGHAGLFSTAGNLLTFLEMLLHEGTFRGVSYFSKETVLKMQTNQIAHLNDFTGLGWELNQPRFMGAHASHRTFGKTGFTGTLVVVDIPKSTAYTILSNRIYPKRPESAAAINAFRAKAGTIILA